MANALGGFGCCVYDFFCGAEPMRATAMQKRRAGARVYSPVVVLQPHGTPPPILLLLTAGRGRIYWILGMELRKVLS